MNEPEKTTESEKVSEENKQAPKKSLTHFNWFARFESSQTEKHTVLKS